ncbi:hypothetical protein D4R75_00560 [bacterium]|nr:MAG: hypothetical protein D4R75_00560 [bacterium]
MKKISLSITVCFALLACAQDRPIPAGLQEIQFAVDSSLVNPSILDTALGISFAPPRTWDAVPAKALKAAQREAASHSDVSPGIHRTGGPNLLYAWSHAPSGGVITIASFADFDTGDSSVTLQEFAKYYRSAMPQGEVKMALFTTKTFKIHQLMASDEKRVNFKMVFSSLQLKKPIQFDFVVPRGAYPQMVKTIESVAGSVEVHPSNTSIN